MLKNGIFTAFQLMLIASYADVISKSVDCKDVAGTNPSWSLFSTTDSVATCPSGYTVTSCGAKSLDFGNEDDITGAYFYRNGCKARTRWTCPLLVGCFDGGGVKAYARCCDLNDYGSSFAEVVSGSSGFAAGALATATCVGSTKMIGCTGYVNQVDGDAAYDGSMMGTEYRVNGETNTCIARNGVGGGGAYAKAKCYDTSRITDGYEFDCIAVWGNINGGVMSRVSCPNNYFMPSCNGYSPWSNLLEYTAGNTECLVIKKDVDEVVASAMWYVRLFLIMYICTSNANNLTVAKCTNTHRTLRLLQQTIQHRLQQQIHRDHQHQLRRPTQLQLRLRYPLGIQRSHQL